MFVSQQQNLEVGWDTAIWDEQEHQLHLSASKKSKALFSRLQLSNVEFRVNKPQPLTDIDTPTYADDRLWENDEYILITPILSPKQIRFIFSEAEDIAKVGGAKTTDLKRQNITLWVFETREGRDKLFRRVIACVTKIKPRIRREMFLYLQNGKDESVFPTLPPKIMKKEEKESEESLSHSFYGIKALWAIQSPFFDDLLFEIDGESDAKSQSESLDEFDRKTIKLDVPFRVMRDLQDIFMLRNGAISFRGERLAGEILPSRSVSRPQMKIYRFIGRLHSIRIAHRNECMLSGTYRFRGRRPSNMGRHPPHPLSVWM